MLVTREIDSMNEDASKVLISNSGYINLDNDDDLAFLKAEELYMDFLQDLLKKLWVCSNYEGWNASSIK